MFRVNNNFEQNIPAGNSCIILALLFLLLSCKKQEFLEVNTGGVLQKKLLLKISQHSQENPCAEVFF